MTEPHPLSDWQLNGLMQARKNYRDQLELARRDYTKLFAWVAQKAGVSHGQLGFRVGFYPERGEAASEEDILRLLGVWMEIEK